MTYALYCCHYSLLYIPIVLIINMWNETLIVNLRTNFALPGGRQSVHVSFFSKYSLISCSLAQKIPGWVIEKSLKVLVRKQQEVSLWKSLRVLCCMAFA